jgi:hypothetical protein
VKWTVTWIEALAWAKAVARDRGWWLEALFGSAQKDQADPGSDLAERQAQIMAMLPRK